MDKSQKLYVEGEKPDHKECICFMIPLYEAKEQAKLIYGDKNQKSNYRCVGGIV